VRAPGEAVVADHALGDEVRRAPHELLVVEHRPQLPGLADPLGVEHPGEEARAPLVARVSGPPRDIGDGPDSPLGRGDPTGFPHTGTHGDLQRRPDPVDLGEEVVGSAEGLQLQALGRERGTGRTGTAALAATAIAVVTTTAAAVAVAVAVAVAADQPTEIALLVGQGMTVPRPAEAHRPHGGQRARPRAAGAEQ